MKRDNTSSPVVALWPQGPASPLAHCPQEQQCGLQSDQSGLSTPSLWGSHGHGPLQNFTKNLMTICNSSAVAKSQRRPTLTVNANGQNIRASNHQKNVDPALDPAGYSSTCKLSWLQILHIWALNILVLHNFLPDTGLMILYIVPSLAQHSTPKELDPTGIKTHGHTSTNSPK